MKKAYRALLLAVATAGLSAVTAGAALAGYGPTPPPGQPVPGGFQSVVVSKTVATDGGSMTAPAGAAKVVVTVPQGALNVPLQITVTKPSLSVIESALPARYDAVAGMGVQANLSNGNPVKGHFGNEGVSIEIKAKGIAPGDLVFVWSAKEHKFVRAQATVKDGVAIVKANHFEEFVVVKPHMSK